MYNKLILARVKRHRQFFLIFEIFQSQYSPQATILHLFFTPRAGQKGICSQQWSSEDLPWTESGLVPDIVFNPHGFPSRMTIAMMIECMAGKSGAMHGLCYDATPFRYLCITF